MAQETKIIPRYKEVLTGGPGTVSVVVEVGVLVLKHTLNGNPPGSNEAVVHAAISIVL